MSRQMLAALDAEINVRQDELGALMRARDVLAGTVEEKKAPKAEHKKKARRTRRASKVADGDNVSADPDEFGETINEVFVKMTEQEAQVFEAINAADDGAFVLGPDVCKATGLTAVKVRGAVVTLRNKLEKQAKATIIALRGKGYRLAEL